MGFLWLNSVKKSKYVIFTDQELLDLVLDAKCGDRDSLGLIFKAFEPYIIKIYREFNDVDVDDLIQEIHIAINSAVTSYTADKNTSVSTYIKSVIRTNLSDWLKSNPDSCVDTYFDFDFDIGYDFEDDSCDLQDIYSVVREFDPRDRMIVMLYCQGYNFLEMSKMLGISYYRVLTSKDRIFEKIKTKLYKEEANRMQRVK